MVGGKTDKWDGEVDLTTKAVLNARARGLEPGDAKIFRNPGGRVTEADWRLFPTLLRFDPVYHVHFKCSRRRIRDYRHLWPYMLDLYQHPGIAATVIRNTEGIGRSWVSLVIGTALTVFGASTVFAHLQNTLNRIWDVEPKPTNAIWRWITTR